MRKYNVFFKNFITKRKVGDCPVISVGISLSMIRIFHKTSNL